MLKDTHTSQHLQTFIHSPVPEHKHSALLGFLQYSVVSEEMSFNLIWPPALELMGFQMGCQHSSSVHTSLWGMFIKVSHNYTLQTLVSLFRRLDVKTVGVSAKVWQTTSVCISCIFIFTIGFWTQYALQHIWKSACLQTNSLAFFYTHTHTHTELCMHVPSQILSGIESFPTPTSLNSLNGWGLKQN